MNISARKTDFSHLCRTLLVVGVVTTLSCEESPSEPPTESGAVNEEVWSPAVDDCWYVGDAVGVKSRCFPIEIDLDYQIARIRQVGEELQGARLDFATMRADASGNYVNAREAVRAEAVSRSDTTEQPTQAQVVPSAPARALVANLRIDGTLHDWASIRSVRAATDGRILVLATNAPGKQPTEIRVFNASGVLVDTIGRSGQGPGEFVNLAAMGVVGDTIWAGDGLSRRVSWFRGNGTLIRSIAADSLAAGGPPKQGSATPWLVGWSAPQAVFTDGTMLIRPAIGPIRGTAPVPVYRTSSSGIVLDTVVVLQMNVQLVVVPRPAPANAPASTSSGTTAGGRASPGARASMSGGGMMPIDIPFPMGQQHAISVDGHRIATAEAVFEGAHAFTIHLRVVDEKGQNIIDRHYPFERIAIPARVADSAIAAIATRTRVAESVIREAVPIPPSTNPVTGLLVDRDGTVWLRGREGPAGASWMVIDARGNSTATVRQPANARFIALDGGLWSVERNADDVESLVRYRLAPGG